MQIEHDGPLVAAGHLPPQAVAVLGGTHLAQRIAIRVLDLDDVGAEVPQHHRRQRAGKHRGAVDHLEPGQRPILRGIAFHCF
jgi:hypothetical protein